MEYLAVQIVRFEDEHQPGWVACELLDAGGHSHTFIDVPVMDIAYPDAANAFPKPGALGCEIIARWRDADDRELVRVCTDPWGVSSTEGVAEFVVLTEQLWTPWKT
jgi:hypothetical protein